MPSPVASCSRQGWLCPVFSKRATERSSLHAPGVDATCSFQTDRILGFDQQQPNSSCEIPAWPEPTNLPVRSSKAKPISRPSTPASGSGRGLNRPHPGWPEPSSRVFSTSPTAAPLLGEPGLQPMAAAGGDGLEGSSKGFPGVRGQKASAWMVLRVRPDPRETQPLATSKAAWIDKDEGEPALDAMKGALPGAGADRGLTCSAIVVGGWSLVCGRARSTCQHRALPMH